MTILPDAITFMDVLDIALVSTLIYVVYSLFGRTRSARMLLGLVATTIVYLGAQLLALNLTLAILQAFYAVIIIALIVIFQDEIRRLFEQIGNNRWFGRSPDKNTAQTSSTERRVQMLVDSAADLAAKRIGALIVLNGKDDVESMMNGGIMLNGLLSEPLLKSIFDAHSPGHDGAVVVVGDQISKFACHLPLSAESEKIKGFGTRHAAGLGITERTDALSIIVSEERGSISVAQSGELTVLANPTELSSKLLQFYDSASHISEPNRSLDWITHNMGPKLISVFVAIVLWLLLVVIPARNGNT